MDGTQLQFTTIFCTFLPNKCEVIFYQNLYFFETPKSFYVYFWWLLLPAEQTWKSEMMRFVKKPKECAPMNSCTLIPYEIIAFPRAHFVFCPFSRKLLKKIACSFSFGNNNDGRGCRSNTFTKIGPILLFVYLGYRIWINSRRMAFNQLILKLYT